MLVNVQLEDGAPITQMDDAFLYRRELAFDDEDETTHVIEYYLLEQKAAVKAGGLGMALRPVHRSVHVQLKKGLAIHGEQARLG